MQAIPYWRWRFSPARGVLLSQHNAAAYSSPLEYVLDPKRFDRAPVELDTPYPIPWNRRVTEMGDGLAVLAG